ncbi:hypothetical protein L202_06949 [Cryptococcus amylolentus CBS 6039]|uniref:Thioredoxin-like fold domain-containing protein n=2 Tax=Cryptococcus amylolentus TaxID=104669 RepID=A0A1E3HE20_9TREE|nr:hypothetical protein L202_06949 [Cryptococcus amylolentus CBS 6039]ODN74590.1 hypothetical protein L202_06949 [Cryptococcus amylolentus CBS 6039]ODO01552.1 hypothetical protein I350_06372 [Cryptococcus amylolentus CBS 6273]
MSTPVEIPVDLVGQSSLYNVPDPILRRLRLEDQHGQTIKDLDKYFAEKEVLVFYAGAQYKSAAVIYVSADTDPLAPASVLQGKPWLRMIFNDDSDFAVVGKEKDGGPPSIQEVARGENFIQAGEIELGMEKVELGVEEYQNEYVRPLSRAGLTSIMDVFATPSVAVYHLESHQFVAKNVKPAAFKPTTIDKTYDTWRKGGEPSLRVIGVDVVRTLKLPLIGLLLAVIYRLLILFGGDEYHVIPRWLDGISWNQGGRDLSSDALH